MCNSYKGVQGYALEDTSEGLWMNQQMFTYVTTGINTFRSPPINFSPPMAEPADLKGLYF
jgi:hypothetical protein